MRTAKSIAKLAGEFNVIFLGPDPPTKPGGVPLFFFYFLEESSRRARHLFAALSRDPDLFASLVVARYKAEEENLQLKRTLNEEAWMRSACLTVFELKPELRLRLPRPSDFPPIFQGKKAILETKEMMTRLIGLRLLLLQQRLQLL